MAGNNGAAVVLVYPAPADPDVVRVLDFEGVPWTAIDDRRAFPTGVDVAGIIADASKDLAGALAMIGLVTGRRPGSPSMLLVRAGQLGDFDERAYAVSDFCITPFHPQELTARVRKMLASPASSPGQTSLATTVDDATVDENVIAYGDLVMNVSEYSARVGARPLDLTFMEYELLRYLASQPGRVFSRAVLLSQVWGYEYFGGARTVDVHVRRLRAKLGEERGELIQTIRSVGYRFGSSADPGSGDLSLEADSGGDPRDGD